MSRAKSLKMYYESQPENCPMCGKRTVVELSGEEKVALRSEQERMGGAGQPAWRCTSCGAVLWQGKGEE